MKRKAPSLVGMSFDKIMVQQATQVINEPEYCRYCGKNVKDTPQVTAWEIENNAHETCYRKNRFYGGRR